MALINKYFNLHILATGFLAIFLCNKTFAGRGSFIIVKNSSPYTIIVKPVNTYCVNGTDNLKDRVIYAGQSIKAYLEDSCYLSPSHGQIKIIAGENEVGTSEYSISIYGTEAGVIKNNTQYATLHSYSKNLINRATGQDLIILKVTPNNIDTQQYVNWMEHLKDKIQDISINKLAIPGTHDSFTFNLSRNLCQKENISYFAKFGKNFAQTQELNFTQQLNSGIRYFDTRLCYQNEKIYASHALISNNEFLDELKPLATFIKNNPQEVVILDINHTYGFDVDSFKKFLIDLSNSLNTTQNPNNLTKNFSQLGPNSKLIDFWNLKANIIVIIPNNLFNDIKDYNYNFVLWTEDKIYSPWPNTMDIKELLDKNNNFLNNRPNDKLFVNQLQLTPNKDYIISNLDKNLEYIAYNVLTDIYGNSGWLWSTKIVPMNIFITDYSDGYEGTIYSINTNQNYNID